MVSEFCRFVYMSQRRCRMPVSEDSGDTKRDFRFGGSKMWLWEWGDCEDKITGVESTVNVLICE